MEHVLHGNRHVLQKNPFMPLSPALSRPEPLRDGFSRFHVILCLPLRFQRIAVKYILKLLTKLTKVHPQGFPAGIFDFMQFCQRYMQLKIAPAAAESLCEGDKNEEAD